jgi:hypothetical protein
MFGLKWKCDSVKRMTSSREERQRLIHRHVILRSL